jgi:hypothetical protein
MKSFSEISKEFFATNNCDKLISQLKLIEKYGNTKPGDHYAFGCEIILNGMNIGTNDYSLSELIESYYDYYTKDHYIPFVNNWDTFLFFSPDDFRGLIFDFSYFYSDGKVICYNGLNGFKNLEKVNEYTIDEFLNEYGLSRLFSISHWNVNWKKLGVKWNN